MDLNLSVEVFPPKGRRDFVGAPFKLLLALSSLIATPRVLVCLIRVDKSFETFRMTARLFARLGISKPLFGGGFGLDLVSSFWIPRKARGLSLFCEAAGCSEAYNLSVNMRLGCACVCLYSVARFYNFAEAFAKLSVRSCLLLRR